jgi:hypothetical protein
MKQVSLTDQHRQTLQPNEPQEPSSPSNRASLAIEVGLDLVHARELLQLRGCVWWVPDIHQALDPCRCGCDTAAMCEGIEGGFAAVGALAGGADAAESECGNGCVVETVVQRGAARACLIEDWNC